MIAVELNLERLARGRSRLPLRATLSREDPTTDADPVVVVLSGELQVDDMDQRILVHGSFHARQTVCCDRCAREFELATDPEIEVMILRNPSRTGEDPEGGDAWIIHQRSGIVSLDEPLLEAVVLADPQKILCRQDCKGLCPRCGCDLNVSRCECVIEEIDPRWSALGRLKEEDSA